MRVLDGRYRLDQRIGTGGTAEVWRGYDLVLERTVAVKMLLAALAADPRAGARARVEALTAARLSHPNVATVYDFGELRTGLRTSNPYLVMEFVDGETLQARLRRDGALPWHAAATICGQVAAALAVAHERGMVHRDVKPGNVMLTAAGVKVVDFGIAAAVGQAQTDTGEIVLGTPLYMAPEQLRGDPVVPASDMYALGLLLYECLTGRRPWPAGTPADIAMARADNLLPAPLPSIDGLPDAVAQLCRGCLDNAPGGRPTALHAAKVLADVAGTSPAALDTVVSPRPAGSLTDDRLHTVTAGASSGMAQRRRAWRPLSARIPVATATAVTTMLAAVVVARLSTGSSLGSLVGIGASAHGIASGCVARYAAHERRDGSFTAALTVTNLGGDALETWSLTFSLPTGQHMTTMDGANWTGVGTEVTLHSGGTLAAGATATLTMAGTYVDGGGSPTGFALDGVDCRQETSVVSTARASGPTPQPIRSAPRSPAADRRPASPTPTASPTLTPRASARPSPSSQASPSAEPEPTLPLITEPSTSASAHTGPSGSAQPSSSTRP